MKRISKFSHGLYSFLHKPHKVVVLCSAILICSLLFNGALINLYSLRRGQEKLIDQMASSKIELARLNKQIQVTKDPHYIERQAVDNYDLVSEGDLIFVFSED